MARTREKNGPKRLPQPAHPWTATQVLLILFFALFGAFALSWIGPQMLNALYALLAERLNMNAESAAEGFRSSPLTVGSLSVLGAVIGSFLGNRLLSSLERVGLRWDRLEVGDKVTLFVGIFAGLVATVPLLQVFQYLNIDPAIKVLLFSAVTIGLCALSAYALQSMADILPWNRTRVGGRRSGIKILDTNVIIDGRIYDVVKAGFLEGQIYIPRFVLEELQFIADNSDPLKRQRGRRGLEILGNLQSESNIEVGTYDRLAPDTNEEVDSRIVRLAHQLGADVVTNDFNLNRVATLQNVRVLSLNDLALALRTNVMPQETLTLKIIREGNQMGQGVGYLEDGTMVVVENGYRHVGETVDVVVSQLIQTERGKMVFAEVEGETEGRTEGRRRSTRRNHA